MCHEAGKIYVFLSRVQEYMTKNVYCQTLANKIYKGKFGFFENFFLKGRGHGLIFPFLNPSAWNADVKF